jgi:hypothetical protein
VTGLAFLNDHAGPAKSAQLAGPPLTKSKGAGAHMTDTLLETALFYLGQGWRPVPVPHRKKGPVIDGWQTLRITADTAPKYFNGARGNIGVIMTGGLCDVDLDSPEAVIAAPRFLAQPTCSFGRPGKRNSHFLYYAPGLAEAVGQATIPFIDPVTPDKKKAILCELRCGGEAGHAAQTIFPPSTHKESGELIGWEDNLRDPLTVLPAALRKAVSRIAVCSVLARHMPASGARHNAFLTLGGFLSRGGFAEPDVARP